MQKNIFIGLLFLIGINLMTVTYAKSTKSVWDRSQEPYSGNLNITVYRSPKCGCCGDWIEHLKKHNFQVTDIKTEDMDPIKFKFGVPPNMESCHTAIIDGYVIEGHVPADDIKRLMKNKPQIAGLSVPEMPIGPPGMERENRKNSFSVFSFDKRGNSETFLRYKDY